MTFRDNEVWDPVRFLKLGWPHVNIYEKQAELLYSVANNDETFCVAGNMLGKDFISAYVVLWFFLTRHPCRVVTTSADHPQLEAVLWGELRRWINDCRLPILHGKGGNLVVNHLHLRKVVFGKLCSLSYVIGRVSAKGEGLLGHHVADTGDGIPRTLLVGDEASALDDAVKDAADTWARRQLYIGNPWPCSNFFKRAVKQGDLLPGGKS